VDPPARLLGTVEDLDHAVPARGALEQADGADDPVLDDDPVQGLEEQQRLAG
jgi:hypothetical protein